MIKVFGRHISKWKLFLLIGDGCIYFLALIITIFLNPMAVEAPLMLLVNNKLPFLLVGGVYLVGNYILDLYDYQQDYRRWVNIAQILVAVLLSTLANITIFYFVLGSDVIRLYMFWFVGRVLLLILASLFAVFMVLWRYAFSASALPQRLQRRIVIVGAGSSGQRILQALRNRPNSGLVPIGFLDDAPSKLNTKIHGLPVLDITSRLPEIVSQYQISLVVVAITHEKSPNLVNILTRLSWNGIQVVDMPGFYEFLSGKVPIDHISDVWIFFHGLNKNKLYIQHFKRLLDLALSCCLLITTAPFFLLIALAIRLDSPGPVFFLQDRLGDEGRPFKIIKFRTMIQDAERDGPRWAMDNDHRITRVGKLLRRFRLDELPQLVNIIKGEMSFIGPRPEREVFVRDFNDQIPYYNLRLLVKPGITGWAQVMYPYASSLEHTREKLQYDLYYVKNMGFFLDLAILLKTVRIVMFGRGT